MNNDTLKAIITVGIPASGKTTFASTIIERDSTYVEVNRDMIRREVFDSNGWSDYVFSDENERKVTNVQFEKFRDLQRASKNIIVTDTNLKMKYLRGTINFLKHLGYDVSIKLCPITLQEAIRRNSVRKLSLPLEEISRQYNCYSEMEEKVHKKYEEIVIQ